MRFRKGGKVRIKYRTPQGRPRFATRWWHQVDALIARYRDRGCTDFYVKGRGWKDWRPVTTPTEGHQDDQ